MGYGKVFNSNYYFGGELYTRYAHNTINASASMEASDESINAATSHTTIP